MFIDKAIVMDIPIENQRVRDVINYYYKGNESQFSKDIGVSQPRINRLFNPDPRSNKYPSVSFEIIQAITNMFMEINAEWLITGRGTMLKKERNIEINELDTKYITRKRSINDNYLDDYISTLKKNSSMIEMQNEQLRERIKYLETENAQLKKEVALSNSDKKITKK